MGKSGPNYAAIAGKALLGAVGGVGLAVAIGHGPLEWVAGGVLGFGAVVGALVGIHAAHDARKLTLLAQVRKKTDEATRHQALGKLESAEQRWQEVLELLEAALGERDLQTLNALYSLGKVQQLGGRFDRAEASYRKALPLYGQLVDARHPSLVQCHKDLAATLERLGRYPEALAEAERALELDGSLAHRLLVARLQTENGNDQAAMEHYRRFLEAAPNEDADSLMVKNLLASSYAREQRYPEATELLKSLLLQLKGQEHPYRTVEVEAILGLAEVRLAQGAVKDVEPLCLAGLKVLQHHVGPHDRLLTRLFTAYRAGREKSGAGLKDHDLLKLFSEEERETARDALKANPEWVNNKDKTGWTALQWAAFLFREDLLRWLLRNGARPDNYEASSTLGPIHVAAAWGKLSALEALLDAGVDINSVGPGGLTPVLYSVRQGRSEITRQLVVRGADPQRADAQGRTPLHYAAAAGHLEVAEYLLGRGVDLHARAAAGRTPLHLAAAAGQGALVELLLLHKADQALRDDQGRTASELAGAAGHALLVKAMA